MAKRQFNVKLDEALVLRAKIAALRRGERFTVWLADAITDKLQREGAEQEAVRGGRERVKAA